MSTTVKNNLMTYYMNQETTAIQLIATSLGRRDDKPNQDLAVEIIRSKRIDWVKELVDNLYNKDKNIQSDCIKVLYEIGELGAADLIVPYCETFGNMLTSKNNRLVWGVMTALDIITTIQPETIFKLLPRIILAMDDGSVITKDHGVGILTKLSAFSAYAETTFPLLLAQLKICPPKQLPMYAEKSIIAVHPSNKKQFIELIQARLSEMEKDSQKQRLYKLIRKMDK